jgi:hypothetical protein
VTEPTTDTAQFPIRFTGFNRAMTVLGLRPANSNVVVAPGELTVRMGWAFRSTIPRTSIVGADHDTGRVLGWGVHGWRGRWLVNGSSSNIVRIDIDPEVRARVAGLPVRLSQVRVSVDDPDNLVAALH